MLIERPWDIRSKIRVVKDTYYFLHYLLFNEAFSNCCRKLKLWIIIRIESNFNRFNPIITIINIFFFDLIDWIKLIFYEKMILYFRKKERERERNLSYHSPSVVSWEVSWSLSRWTFWSRHSQDSKHPSCNLFPTTYPIPPAPMQNINVIIVTYLNSTRTCNSRETLIFPSNIFTVVVPRAVLRDSTRRGIQDSHVPTTTIVYLNYEYSINAKCRFLNLNGISFILTKGTWILQIILMYSITMKIKFETLGWRAGIARLRPRGTGGLTDGRYATILSLRARNHFLFSRLFLKNRSTWINK